MGPISPGALLAVYLGATGLLLLLGPGRVGGTTILAHAGVLAFVAAATWLPPVPRWLRDWAPLLVLLFLYSEIPALIRAAGHTTLYDPVVWRLEDAVFGSQPALSWAAAMPSRGVSEVLHGFYLSYYAVIFVVPVVLYAQRRRTEYVEAVLILLTTFVVCFACYIAFPVAGPRYLWVSPADEVTGPIRALATWLLEARSSRGTAFPSSHVAVAVTQSVLAVRYFGSSGLVIAVAALGLALGAVYGGFHYAIDVVAGAVVGLLVPFAILAATFRRVGARRPQANATAPT